MAQKPMVGIGYVIWQSAVRLWYPLQFKSMLSIVKQLHPHRSSFTTRLLFKE